MTEKQKILGIVKGLELYNLKGFNQDFLDYLDALTMDAQAYIIPYFEKLNLLICNRTRSGKYTIRGSLKKPPDNNQINELIKKINNGEIILP